MQMKQSLLRYKYYGSREYGWYYAEEICRYVGTQIKRWNPDILVPVPMTCRKKRIRGFNQAEDLAEKIGELLQIPVAAGLAVKKRETKISEKTECGRAHEKSEGCFSDYGIREGA